MAQTKRKRQTKHRGNAAGSVTTRGRTGRPPSPSERKKQSKDEARQARLNRQPTWKMMYQRAAFTSVVMFAVLLFATKGKGLVEAIGLAVVAFALYVPFGYYTETWLWKRRMAKQGKAIPVSVEASMFTVGPVQENAYVVRLPGAASAVMVDPGAEAPRLLEALRALEITTLEAILLTHTHFDHIGAVAEVARATGAPVYVPEREIEMLRDPNAYLRLTGFGPFEGHEAEHTVGGGETLELAGLRFEVRFVPGHSIGHVSYGLPDHGALFSGDVLFQGSVGRVDLPGGDWATLEASIGRLLDEYPDAMVVHPGHMGLTTLGTERATNPFLRELAHNH